MSINKRKLEQMVDGYPGNGVPPNEFWMADSLLALSQLVAQLTRRLEQVEEPVQVDERARLDNIWRRVGGGSQ